MAMKTEMIKVCRKLFLLILRNCKLSRQPSEEKETAAAPTEESEKER